MSDFEPIATGSRIRVVATVDYQDIRVTYAVVQIHAHPVGPEIAVSLPPVVGFDQSVEVSDGILYHPQTVYADSVSTSDTINYFTLGQFIVESVTPSDVFDRVVDFDRDPADTVTPSDVLISSTGSVLTDSVTPSDALVFVASVPLADTVSPADAAVVSFGKVLADGASAADVVALNFAKALGDSVTITDDADIAHLAARRFINGAAVNEVSIN